jgi:putative NIF3 family GTP cyclohydrolase 1 type 2
MKEKSNTGEPARANVDRRKFISNLTKAAGSAVYLAFPLAGKAKNFLAQSHSWTVGEIMDLFIKEVPGAPFKNTVDTLKAGSRDIKVTGIVTTMFATLEVIRKAIDLNANFIIAHEPTFYNHLDETSWLEKDEVYQYKADLLKKNKIAVWRNHDYIHRLMSDGVTKGVVSRLKWDSFLRKTNPNILEIPSTDLKALIGHVKESLGISTVRYIGDLSQACKKILLMPGASGGRSQIAAIGSEKPDAVLCGELQEWETAEYVRDANIKGQKISLIVMGHVASEEPGSEFMVSWLMEKVKGVVATHVPAGNSLLFL